MGNLSKEKVPELYKAKRALIAYLRENNIDPSDTKRIQTDPKLKDLVYKLNKERDKVMYNYPALDRSNNIKLLKMAKKDKEPKKKVKKVAEAEPTSKKKVVGRATKYDYPQQKDPKTGKMREMTKDEKKAYRAEQRKAAKGESPKTKKKVEKEAPVADKKKKASDEKKSKTSKKAKSGKKVED